MERAELLVRSLARPAGFDHPVDAVEIVETHISWVLLTGEYAYKLKKPLELPFADFSTLAKRKALCDVEVRLNRRLAPDLYCGVVPIGGTVEDPVVGEEPAIEYAVKMRQFPPPDRLDHLLERGETSSADIRALAERIAIFHASLEPDRTGPFGSRRAVAHAALENFEECRALFASEDAAALAELSRVERWTRDACARLGPEFERRKREGAVVEGHGDLHAENIVRLAEGLVPFDALEFSEELRWTDRAAELAFLAMDLAVRGRTDLGYEFLDAALSSSGDYPGLRVLRFYLVYRAMVRVKVAAIGRAQRSERALDPADPHAAFAAGATSRGPALLVITRGLSGSGKTTITEGLIGCLPAVRIRSDVERKRMHGLAADASSGSAPGAGLYAPEKTKGTYGRLAECAAAALEGGLSAIVDATFLRRHDREQFLGLARRLGAGFIVLDCTAPADVLRERVRRRTLAGGDASEATVEVLERQLESDEPLAEVERARAVTVDTTRRADARALAERIRRAASVGSGS